MSTAKCSAAPAEGLHGFDEVRHCEVLVLGSGAAGLSAALAAANAARDLRRARGEKKAAGSPDYAEVVLATKLALGEGGSTPWAQGGIAAAVGHDDSTKMHAEDTLEVGWGLCDTEAVQELTEGGPEAIERLLRHGTRFDRRGDGAVALGREGGHRRHRILHTDGDRTGAEISRALVAAVQAHPHIRVQEHWFAVDLLLWDGPLGQRVTGVAGLQGAGANRRKVAYIARSVVLACGGAGQIFRHTTNPPAVTGDGIAMAARAGALLADMEFFQFHPTTLDVPALEGSSLLLTEALRGAGALLVGADAERFMVPLHPLAELAPRDLVARTLWERRERGLASYLDLRPVIAARGPLAESFPTAAASCARAGLDPAVDLVPVVPAAHYMMGGVCTDAEGRTSLPGLWAAGEVASSGVHGANRLASNSLLEALVFGERVARRALLDGVGAVSFDHLEQGSRVVGDADWSRAGERSGEEVLRSTLGEILWRDAGLVRSAESLERAAHELHELARSSAERPGEARNLLLVGRLLVSAARQRRESRGAHFRSDYPARDPNQRRRSYATLSGLLGDDQQERTGQRSVARR